jgi:uncharacterized RDD family membrane protein YckC
MTYAGFWKRFGANSADGLIFLLVGALYVALGSFSRPLALALVVPVALLYPVYAIYFHARSGQTPGKMLAGIRVVKVSGEAISWRNATLRSSVDVGPGVLHAISSMVALLSLPEAEYLRVGWMERQQRLGELAPVQLGWVPAASMMWVASEVIVLLFNKKRRALHDYIAGTVVLDLRLGEHSTLARVVLPVGRSAWAIAAGYLGLVSVLVLPAPLALFTGILEIRDIRRHPQ